MELVLSNTAPCKGKSNESKTLTVQRERRLVTLEKTRTALANVVQLVEATSHIPEDCGFDSQSEHMPRLQVGPQLGRMQPIIASLSQ